MKEIKVYRREDGRYTNYCFVEGPYKDEVAFGFKKNAYEEWGSTNACFVNKDPTKWFHLIGFEIVEPKPMNTITIEASCGQTQEIELTNIDKNQPIGEVTIRGVKYIPSK